MSEEYGVGLAKELMNLGDRDTRSLRQKLQDLEEGDSVRIVTESRDVLARVEEDVQVREDVEVTERIVEALVKVYGDTQSDHEMEVISWWKPGPVILGDEKEHVERLEFK
jgi:hypothetical protein